MKKDKAWFIKELIGHEIGDYGNYYNGGYEDGLAYALKLAHQLDEPETLSQEWIHENKEMYLINDTSENAVPDYKLQNLLVPKQELPVIPKFVSEWYESEGKLSSWWNWFYKWGRDEGRSDLETKTIRWMQDYNEEKFVDMFLHGYEVKEEPKYHVLIKGHELVHDYDVYWNYDKSDDSVFVSRLHPPHDNFTTEMSKSEWNKLGINDSNADFVKVDE